MLEHVDIVVVALDRQGVVTKINRYGANVLGLPAEKIIGMNWFEHFLPQPEGMELAYPSFQRIMAGDLNPEEYSESGILTAEGELLPIAWRTTCEFDAAGQITGVLSTGTSISSLRLAPDSFVSASSVYRQLFMFSPLPKLIFASGSLRFLDVNAAAISHYGYEREEFLVLSVPDLVPAEGLAKTKDWFSCTNRIMAGNVVRNRRKDGGIVEMAIWIQNIDFDGTKARLAICLDVTANRHLEAANQEKLMLASRLEMVREEERMRISRELHDELGQMLTAVKMSLRRQIVSIQYLDHQLALDMVDVARMVDDTTTIVRRISHELRPRILDTLDLSGAIESEIVAFRKRMGLRCQFNGPDRIIVLPEHLLINIYRLFQEALTNISRHARASRVKVSLSVDAGTLELLIEDNGQGIPVDAISANTLGLLGMKERTAKINGVLSFETRPDIDGTRITLRLPMDGKPEGLTE